MAWSFIIYARSGIVVGITEAIILLILSPIITRGTAIMCDYFTTSRVLKGRLVKISHNYPSVEDLIPRLIGFIRAAGSSKVSSSKSQGVAISGHFMALLISLLMTFGILTLNIFTDGVTKAIIEPREVFLWNGGKFVDTTATTGLDSKASDVFGMAGIRSACVDIIEPGKFNMSAVGFFEKQDFETGRSANASICLNGVQTSQNIGITVSTNRIFNPRGDPVLKKSMEGEPATFQFLSYIQRTGTPDYCQVNVDVQGTTEKWTLGREDSLRTRFGALATRNQNGEIFLRVGVAYHNFDTDEEGSIRTGEEECENLSQTMFANNRFNATIVEFGIKQDLRQLELVIVDMLDRIVGFGHGSLESQNILIRAYFAGTSDSDENSGEPLGTFVPRQVNVVIGQHQVTEMSLLAIIGVFVTLGGSLLLLVVTMYVRPKVRLSSTRYISELHRESQLENVSNVEPNDTDRGEDYVQVVRESDGTKRVRLVCERDLKDGMYT